MDLQCLWNYTINAAKNLKALGTSASAFEEDVRPTCRQFSMKKEGLIPVQL